MKLVVEFPDGEELKKYGLGDSIRRYVLKRLVGLYTCFNINELSSMLLLERKEAEKLVKSAGYKQEDEWVILEEIMTRGEKSLQEKEALRNKIF